MDRIRLKDKEFELFIPEEEIKDAIAKVAERIREDVKGTNPLFVGILNVYCRVDASVERTV